MKKIMVTLAKVALALFILKCVFSFIGNLILAAVLVAAVYLLFKILQNADDEDDE